MKENKQVVKVENVYVVRALPHGVNKENEFLNGIISVGWPCLGDLSGKKKEEIEPIFNEAWPTHGPRNLTQLYNFVTIPIGTIVLTPSKANRDIHIFVTTSSYYYNQDQDIESNDAPNPLGKGNPHQIKVDYLKTVTRNVFPANIQSALKAARRTVSNFSKYAVIIEAIVNKDCSKELKEETPDYKLKAIETLKGLLDSKDDNIRLQAAINLMNIEKGDKK